MKKLLLFLLLIPSICFAGPLQQKHLAVIAGSTVKSTPAGDSVSLRNSNSDNTTGNDTTLNVSAPSGTTVGDRMFAICHSDIAQAITASGWAQIDVDSYIVASSSQTTILYRDFQSGDTNWDFTQSTNAGMAISITSLSKSGGTWSTPTYTTAGGGESAIGTIDTTAISPTDGSMLLIGGGNDGAFNAASTPSGMEAIFSTSSTDPGLQTWYQAYASAASDVTKTMTWSASTEQCTAVAIVQGVE